MHSYTICELAMLRHHELQEFAAQQRLASQARAPHHRQPGIVTATRLWCGSALIDIGMRLRGIAEVGEPLDAFGSPERVGLM